MLDKNTLNQVVIRSYNSIIKTIESMVNNQLSYQRKQLIFQAIKDLQQRGVLQDTIKSELQFLGVRQINKQEFDLLYKMVIVEIARQYGFKTPEDSVPVMSSRPSMGGSNPFSIGPSDEYVLPANVGIDGADVSRLEVDPTGTKYLIDLARIKKAANKIKVVNICPANYETDVKLTDDSKQIETSCRKRGY